MGATGANWEVTKVVQTNEQDGNDVETEEGVEILETENHFLSLAIPEK